MVRMPTQLQHVMQPFGRSHVFHPETGQGYIQLRCDVTVGAIAMDSQEAANTFNAMARFHCVGDTHKSQTNAACLLCQTPTYKYSSALTELTGRESKIRIPALMEKAWEESCPETLDRLGAIQAALH